MTSPYIASEAKRLNIGAKADFRRDVFPRQQTSPGPIERSAPIKSWGTDILTLTLIVVTVIAWVFAMYLGVG